MYSILLGIYCINTINIYAGINGLEVGTITDNLGQSIIAASSMLCYYTVLIAKGNQTDYRYSAYILIAFLGTALALMKHNAYPSKIFIGDTFCYFAGAVLALAALFGN